MPHNFLVGGFQIESPETDDDVGQVVVDWHFTCVPAGTDNFTQAGSDVRKVSSDHIRQSRFEEFQDVGVSKLDQALMVGDENAALHIGQNRFDEGLPLLELLIGYREVPFCSPTLQHLTEEGLRDEKVQRGNEDDREEQNVSESLLCRW